MTTLGAAAKLASAGAAAGALCLTILTGGARAEHQTHYELAQRAIDGYVVPSLAAFGASSRQLAAATGAFCAAPGDARRKELVAAFAAALSDWARVEIVRTGPATREGRAQRIAFWPDPRGSVERQMRQALAQRQPEIGAAETLRSQSAAVQGFPALEMLIADTGVDLGGADEEARYRCQVATAIASNIAALAHDIHDGWVTEGGWRDHMLRPGSDNPDYPSAETSATDLFKALTTSLQAIIESQLQPLAGSEARAPGTGGAEGQNGGTEQAASGQISKGESANEAAAKVKKRAASQPYRRLGLSRAYLLAGIRGCRALYEAARLSSYLDAGDPEQRKLKELVDTAFTQTERQVDIDAWNMTDRAGDAEARTRAARVANTMLGGARRVIATRLAAAAEISLGFNELDGD